MKCVFTSASFTPALLEQYHRQLDFRRWLGTPALVRRGKATATT